MKEDRIFKTPRSENRYSQQFRPSSQRNIVGLQSFESQKLQDALQSSIAQEQIFCSELKRNDEIKKKKFRLTESSNNFKQPSQNIMSKFNSDINNYNSHLLLGQSISKRSQIVSINEIKRYEEKVKLKTQRYKFTEKIDLTLKVNEVSSPKLEKSLKKSLSSSKLARQRMKVIEEKEKSIKINGNEPQNELKQNRNSLDIQSIKSSNEVSLSKTPSSKNIIAYNNSYALYPMVVPFSFQNINTTISNLQTLEIQSNSSRSQIQPPGQRQKLITNHQKQKLSLKKKKNREDKLLKQLNSTKYYINVPLDLNEFSYHLEIEVNLQKNRGFQMYLISPERRSDGIYFEDVMHFKYEMIKLPPNLLRLKVYLLIEKESHNMMRKQAKSPQKAQKGDQMNFSQIHSSSEKQWKVWKQIQIPIMNPQRLQNELNKKIKVSISNIDLNWILIKINNMMEFNLKLNHHEVPVSYFCINQDFNGVELTKISLTGKEKTKTTEDLIGEGCQGKCQLI